MAQGRQSVDLSGRVNAGLNKGEARNALARAVFPCRLGEIRDSSFEQQRYRERTHPRYSLNRTLEHRLYRESSPSLSPERQRHRSRIAQIPLPLGWEHINLTGDYQRKGKKPAQGRFRPLHAPNYCEGLSPPSQADISYTAICQLIE